jgi:hypothetical protein
VSTGENIARALDRMVYYRVSYAIAAAESGRHDPKLNRLARLERSKLGPLIDKAIAESTGKPSLDFLRNRGPG